MKASPINSLACPLVTPRPIREIAEKLGLDRSTVEPHGWYAGKLSLGLRERLSDRAMGLGF